jgi:16S rRNA (cytosine1402-N4)-methyltransferase
MSDTSPTPAGHLPVLLTEAVAGLALRPGLVCVDGTFGAGGHARRIAAEIAPNGRLLCIDRDPAAHQRFLPLQRDFPGIAEFVNASYADLAAILAERGIRQIDGLLLDLGLSSLQLADAERGFSFQYDGPLDMRFDPTRGEPASGLLARIDEGDLVMLLFRWGEERKARRIARAIVQERDRRPIETTRQLATLVERAVGGRRGAPIHPATRTFQALRIAVNDELAELERGLAAGIEALGPGGRIAVISFHSLEDRIVKQTFASDVRGCVCPPETPVCVCGRTPRLRLIGKSITPSPSEVAANPRARSARLRVAERR